MHSTVVVVALCDPTALRDLVTLALVTWARSFGEPAHGHRLYLACAEPGAWPREKSAVLVEVDGPGPTGLPGSEADGDAPDDRVSLIVTEDPGCQTLHGYLGRLTYEPVA
ncbi:hypothetical protein GCM10022215_19140 [Nocardioides fonticola]|uniref:Uncharacterized protein n=1 Tax=Nocardioides fonticola TaxID=450363 RepID=A0ABP7XHX1_9ACTN